MVCSTFSVWIDLTILYTFCLLYFCIITSKKCKDLDEDDENESKTEIDLDEPSKKRTRPIQKDHNGNNSSNNGSNNSNNHNNWNQQNQQPIDDATVNRLIVKECGCIKFACIENASKDRLILILLKSDVCLKNLAQLLYGGSVRINTWFRLWFKW